MKKKSRGYDSEQDTLEHKGNVEKFIQEIMAALLTRAMHHDNSKLGAEEKPLFDKYGGQLKTLKFGSREYSDNLKNLDVAVQDHYRKSRHHPEHFENGIEDMNLLDMLEMLADWKASSLRSHGGSFKHSLEVCFDRFGLSLHNRKMLTDTAKELGWLDE